MNLRRDFSFALLVLAVVGALYYLSTKTKIKRMPANDIHLSAQNRDACMKCHTAETLGALEIQHKHPGKWKDARVACTLCHKPAAATHALFAPSVQPEQSILQLAQSLRYQHTGSQQQ